MKTITLDLENQIDLNKITKSIIKSKKIITLTGAGISCNAGIPDFRSTQGLYSKNLNNNIKGKDLFDISLFRNDSTIEIFCKFMEKLYTKTKIAKPTKTHEFIKNLKNHKKLIKCYTQNIDGLEKQCGLNLGYNENWKSIDVVQLHGDLNKLSCTLCYDEFQWDDENKALLKDGNMPECPTCLNKYRQREEMGKRLGGSSIGLLRPNIVLYGENHPFSEFIAKGFKIDLNKNPNLLLIFGTSLKVDGVRKLVKQLSKKIHQMKDGLVIFINNCDIGHCYWDDYIDYQIKVDCDEWCSYLEYNIPSLFKQPEPVMEQQQEEETSIKQKWLMKKLLVLKGNLN
ncbi:hypothetical protein CANARDRAFT_178180 [[Candida] arabinofermentans NRRL YB-2248]|uniref:Deacetylase sirtuin-type domain-containing protein n=1 Tax=[Candida] arabinofermentans NRRL YB-2248 TaxID=983967 RepID=A0A1E4STW1_9ASCO|nr:hypothetical protein CANARDRAFT_178180 [[Candida] arabinofermentans NRRL YB-2248]